MVIASLGALAASIAGWYAMRSYREQSHPYRIRSMAKSAWTWQESERNGAMWIEIAGLCSMTSYIIQAHIESPRIMVCWGVGWSKYRRHRVALSEIHFELAYPESRRREGLGDIGVQRVWFHVAGPKPKGMPETVTVALVVGYLDGKKYTLTVRAQKGVIKRPRVLRPSDEESSSPPASQSGPGSNVP